MQDKEFRNSQQQNAKSAKEREEREETANTFPTDFTDFLTDLTDFEPEDRKCPYESNAGFFCEICAVFICEICGKRLFAAPPPVASLREILFCETERLHIFATERLHI